MIKLQFAHQCSLKRIETIELPDKSAFFDFYMEHYDKGIIFNVQEVQDDNNFDSWPPQNEEALREIDGQAGENSV